MDNLAAFHQGGNGQVEIIDMADLMAGNKNLQGVDNLIIDAHGVSIPDAHGNLQEVRVLSNDYAGKYPTMADTVSGKDLGAAIDGADFADGGTIKMYTCNAGDAGAGAPAPADAIAKATDSTVVAPNRGSLN